MGANKIARALLLFRLPDFRMRTAAPTQWSVQVVAYTKGHGLSHPVGRGRILVVEDELLVGLDIACMLEERGYEVVDVVDNGNRAISTAARERPDLVLMDITIRGAMDGVTAAQHIHAEAGTPVVFVTSYTEGPLRERAEATNPAGYVTKPFSPPDLERAVRTALDQAGEPAAQADAAPGNVARADVTLGDAAPADEALDDAEVGARS